MVLAKRICFSCYAQLLLLQQLSEVAVTQGNLHQWRTGNTRLALGWCTCVSNRYVTGICVLVFSLRIGDISASTLELQPMVI